MSSSVEHDFFSPDVMSFNQSRMAHLDSLCLPLNGKTVLEPGSGPGVFTKHLISKGCNVHSLEARPENIDYYTNYVSHPNSKIVKFNVEVDDWLNVPVCDVTFCYGLLYHLKDPLTFLTNISSKTKEFCVLETVVSLDTCSDDINNVYEEPHILNLSVEGTGCRPTRKFLINYLKTKFKYVYLTYTQPNFADYPVDFVNSYYYCARCILVASHVPLNIPTLTEEFLTTHIKYVN